MTKPDYGVDAPTVLRNLFLFGSACLFAAGLIHGPIHIGNVILYLHGMFLWTGVALVLEGFLYLLYVKVGKMHHRDYILRFHAWRGDEQVLDVGCGRGLLLIGSAKRLGAGGHATGIDIWSTVDMGGNAMAATQKNIELEAVSDRCSLISGGAQEMPFTDASFDVIVSNLCLHNIYDKATRQQALAEIVRVLKPGGQALISDYKLTSEYARYLREAGFEVVKKRGNVWATFPPLAVVLARKPVS
ncbi:SAM-dependent methyltransferase [Granulicella aggregans]|uniref:SAM-dependent methyltransferase n=1 Tax=Granulicella aggregans TaxID=474949 RepID=A0A7W7Z925_9BACT|nr:methyltransferase domain-containing protein [Granulicella aggregans]MBB5055536.1 SAM-dependent methyltransferase [Granulicella aggregans]